MNTNSIVSSLSLVHSGCVFLAVFLFLLCAGGAYGATYYVVGSGSGDVLIPGDAGWTNMRDNNNSTLGAANGSYRALLKTPSPYTSGTRPVMVESYTTAGSATNWILGRAYHTTPFATDAIIPSGTAITGYFYLQSTDAGGSDRDRFQFRLLDYTPSTGEGSGAVIVESAVVNSPSTTGGVLVTVSFPALGSDYTLPQGHYLGLEIQYIPGGTNRTGRLHCSYDRPSRLNVPLRFSITSSAGSGGTISPLGETLVADGGSQNFTISASSGYSITSLLVDGEPVPGATGQLSYPYPFSNVMRNHTISAAFSIITYNFTIAPGLGGSISLDLPPPDDLVWAGGSTHTWSHTAGTFPFVVTPSSGYGIDWVRLDGVDQGVPDGQTTPFDLSVDIAAHSTLSASFLPYHTVDVSAGTGGTVTPSGAVGVMQGRSLTLAITPDNGYRILSITDNGVPQSVDSSYSLTNVTADHAIVVTFQKTYTITASAGPNGTISPIGEVIVDSGANRNFSLTGNLGFRVGDVLVDGTSVGALTSYSFENVTADHTIEVTFVTAPLPSTYCAIPPFIATAAPPNVMLMLSVETPMMGPANPSVTCTGTPSSTSFNCSTSSSSCSSNGALGCYDNSRNYYGYFESGKCYSYAGSGATGLFSPSGAATNHQCGGTAWSGNFLNWMTTTAVDAFRKAFTGGNRTVDTATDTVLLAARLDSNSWFPDTVYIADAGQYTPYSGTRYFKREDVGIGFGVCNSGQTNCTVARSGSGESQWPTMTGSSNTQAVFSLRIKACDSTGGTETRCNSITNKPEGTIQKYMEKMRFALMSYAADDSQTRDGGVLRSVMKWVAPTISEGMMYHDSTSTVVMCSTDGGCVNPEREVETNGVFRSNPAGASGVNSGIINYINKFAYTSGYKSHDPMGEMYYEVVRYFKNLTPSVDKYCSGLTTSANGDGFAFHCNSSKTNAWGWRRPELYSCSQNFVIAVNDANPWLDKRVPGAAFTGTYRLSGAAGGGNDWCGSSQGACDSDFLDGATQVNVLDWTNKVGDYQGLTPGNLRVGCVWVSGRNCATAYNATTSPYTGMDVNQAKYVTELGRVIGTYPYGDKENSYNVAGLAYYARMTDLRPDLDGNNNLTTYMIDTQEPAGSMLVGPMNMLYLAAKFGGFDDRDGDGRPYKHNSCGGVSTEPHALCSEWDADNDGYPDTYFFASEAARVENALNSAFSNMLNRASSGTAAAVANNKSGERGANIIQALFYPQWPLDKNIRWLGEVQALWYYLDPIINYSGIYEDTDDNFELEINIDLPPGNDPFVTKALWKAGDALHNRTESSRTIFTLLDTSTLNLTNPVNSFTTGKAATLKPLLNVGSLTDAETDSLITYLRGTDGGAYRSRTVTRGSVTGCWKLGDVINSTPQVQSAVPVNAYHQSYLDNTYASFIASPKYKSNNVVYSGSNDGMMHAFKLGQVEKISDPTKPFRIAGFVDDTDLGKEEWAFIPSQALPYLSNQADQNYCHQYLVDGPPLVFDASINKHTDCSGDYWTCAIQTSLLGGAGSNYDAAKTSWRSVLIGSMGLGGASRDGNCSETLNHDADLSNNEDCIKTPIPGAGFSSYFALDVTDPSVPKHMWEFSDAVLPVADRGIGLTTPGVSIVRINTASSDARGNGRWFAVFASGPTGTIDTATRQFLGRSDQNLKIYVVDVNAANSEMVNNPTLPTFVKDVNYWVFDTGIKFAFANSISGAAIDLDRSNSQLFGHYSDDVVYVTYTKATLDSDEYPVDWNQGGVMRLVTKNDPNPANWFLSALIDSTPSNPIGPITTSIGKLQDRNKGRLWIYFGEGRYFFQGDNLNDTRRIFGVSDPCYNYDIDHVNTLSTSAANCPAVSVSGLVDKTSDATQTANTGWFITLDAASGSTGAERVVSDVTAATNGIVFYTTFKPDSDICTAGGTTSLWAVKYDSGGVPPLGGLRGKAPLQTSSGGITMVDLGTAFTEKGGRKLSSGLSPSGMAPKGRFPPLLQPKPVKRIINIQEH